MGILPDAQIALRLLGDTIFEVIVIYRVGRVYPRTR